MSAESRLETMRERMQQAEEAYAPLRLAAASELRFSLGQQWDPKRQRTRRLSKRPYLTINRTGQFCRQVVNEWRQNRPGITLHPVGGQASKDTAEVLQGMVRYTMYQSHGDEALDTALDFMVRAKEGWLRLSTAYVAPDSFDLRLVVEAIHDPASVVLDPTGRDAEGRDAQWGAQSRFYTREEFRRVFPDSEAAGSDLTLWESIGDRAPGWMQGDAIMVAEYFAKEEKPATLVQVAGIPDPVLLVDGEDIPDAVLRQAVVATGDWTVLAERKSAKPVVTRYVTNGLEWLGKDGADGTPWVGQYIPLIRMRGDWWIVDGELHVESLTTNLMDPAKMYNHWATSFTEMIARGAKAPWIVAKGQLRGQEAQWRDNDNVPFLTYNPTTENGIAVPPPQRNIYEPPVQAIQSALLQTSQDMKDVSGIQDASRGVQSNETSAVAIQQRASQSSQSTYHFHDNAVKAYEFLAEQIIDALPQISTQASIAKVLGEDGKMREVGINGALAGDQRKSHYLNAGTYAVRVDMGPNYLTKRQAAVASMLEWKQTDPDSVSVAGDLMVQNMDWPEADAFAERMKFRLAPAVQQYLADQDAQKGGLPPEVAQQMAMMKQQRQQMQAALQQAQQAAQKANNTQQQAAIRERELDLDAARLQLEEWKAQSERDLKLREIEAGFLETEMKTGATVQSQLFRAELDALEAQSAPQPVPAFAPEQGPGEPDGEGTAQPQAAPAGPPPGPLSPTPSAAALGSGGMQ